jgi:hypothetical protein
MLLQARRTFRLSLTIALSLAIAYGLAFPFPFLAPIFALMLTAKPAPPIGLKQLMGLILIVMLTLGIGLLLIPILINYSLSALLIITSGLYFSTYISENFDKAMIGTLLTIGFTIIPAAGLASFPLAVTVIQSMAMGIGLAVICQWLIYPLFPEDQTNSLAEKPKTVSSENANWTALRVTLIVLPPLLAALSNPALYLKLIMKSLALGKQGSAIDARTAGRQLLGSTFLGGAIAILSWFMLDLMTNLWMFFWWMLLVGLFVAGKIYQVIPSKIPASFWIDVLVTMLILLGAAVQDSANGQDVYQAFAMRMSFFILLALYAWLAIAVLERVRHHFSARAAKAISNKEISQC